MDGPRGAAGAGRAGRVREHGMGDGVGGGGGVLSSHAQIAQIMSLSTPPESERESGRVSQVHTEQVDGGRRAGRSGRLGPEREGAEEGEEKCTSRGKIYIA